MAEQLQIIEEKKRKNKLWRERERVMSAKNRARSSYKMFECSVSILLRIMSC